ncbi:F-box/FBD/LRR-repeat protein At4g26340-like [Trifolium pratense]|uniref:F-box/FBD/LRR-repeat protein At4g26340-like n=1 Tax=Trifolium pratense TaxID=57577 RepID=UPI001E69812C|nr:F-box/FBD/LRR-repeat protein At4g26340-like [Trifolium pratense]
MEKSTPIDRISDFSDDILCHILSFLPIKDSFSATILSKRWSSLFKLLTCLHFHDDSVDNEESYLHFWQFVDKITLSTRLIKTIHLSYSSHYDGFNFQRWIETIKRHPVESLHISCYVPLPSSIFRFPTLVVLKLSRVEMAVDNISVDLPSLKTLHLLRVKFVNKDDFNNLLNGCSFLEDLKLHCGRGSLPGPGPGPGPTVKSYYKDCPVLRNLIHLELSITNLGRLDDVVELLQYCPKLQILSFSKWKYPNSVPECISSSLRSFTTNYEGWEYDELRFAKYVLQNARLLEIMKIDMRVTSLYPRPNRLLVLEELSSSPMISSRCKLLTIP